VYIDVKITVINKSEFSDLLIERAGKWKNTIIYQLLVWHSLLWYCWLGIVTASRPAIKNRPTNLQMFSWKSL